MDFFKKEEIDLLNKYAGSQKTDELQNVYESLKLTYNKIEYWAIKVKELLFEKGFVKTIKKPTNQANIFEFYQWAKIYPTKNDLDNKILAYTLSIEKNEKIVIKIDTVGLFENSSNRKKYYEYRKNNPIVKEYTLDDFDNWDELIIRSYNDIKLFEPYYEELKELLELNSQNVINNESEEKIMKHPLNQILYGPPGTGKTYNTINKAIEIANPEFNLNQDRNTIKQEYNRLVEEGQIVFTTFHQSMTYEDFIEGIKPVIEENEDGEKSVVYEVKDGIFKKISKKAIQPEIEKSETSKEYTFDDAFNDLILEANQKLENNEQLFLPILTENLGLKIVGISDRGNLVLKPVYSETAKEYTVSYSRAEKLQAAFPDLSVVKNIDKEFRSVIGGSNSTAYWAVISYINNKINLEKKSNSHNVLLPPKPFVIIIDEINRGNVSQIFGELITLIEEDKRLGNDEALEITLPYSKEKFGVPSNLHIIGTMNTADRSVEALDTALRRRFVFEEMPPKYELEGLQQELYGFKAAEILKTINKRIEKLLDRDHLIGHAYFINKDETTIIDSFYKNIIPLLQEYFFGDYGKIGLVLGSGFIKIIESESIFASFDYENAQDFDDKKSFKILGINDKDFNFENAIKLLMNQ